MPQSAASRPSASSAPRKPCIREAGSLAQLSWSWTLRWRLQFTRKEVFISGVFSRSGTSQSMQRNLRPPVFTSMKLIGLLHFRQSGGGVFLAMQLLALS